MDYVFPFTLAGASIASMLQSALTREFVSYGDEYTQIFEVALAFPTAICAGYLGYTAKSYFQKDKVALDKQSKEDIALAGVVLFGSIVAWNVNYGSDRADQQFYRYD